MSTTPAMNQDALPQAAKTAVSGAAHGYATCAPNRESVGAGGVFALFHVTTGRTAKQYRQTGRINAPVRGFDTLMAAMAWAMKTGRKVIMRIEPVTEPRMLPDHHNAYGKAWWTDAVPIERVKCAYSAEGAWTQPDSLGGTGSEQSETPKP